MNKCMTRITRGGCNEAFFKLPDRSLSSAKVRKNRGITLVRPDKIEIKKKCDPPTNQSDGYWNIKREYLSFLSSAFVVTLH